MTTTETTITTAIPELAKAPSPAPAQGITAAISLHDVANAPAKTATTPAAKEPAATAKPAAAVATKVLAKPAVKATFKLSAKPASKAFVKPTPTAATKVLAKAKTTPLSKKSPLAPKPTHIVVSMVSAKPAVKAALKPFAKLIAKPTQNALIKAESKPKAEKVFKEKKPKLVRDSFTIPKSEYTTFDELKHRAGKLGNSVKKSELIRAGIKALAAMSDTNYLAALKVVPTIKTGRPLKN